MPLPSSELSTVPEDLRGVLEACLSEEATPQNLEIFLPEVRKIITNLLQGLRGKQSLYRRIVSEQKGANGSDRDSRSSRSVAGSVREREREDPIPRAPSRGSTPSNDPGQPPRSKTPTSRRKPSTSENALSPPVPNGTDQQFIGGFAPPGAAAPLNLEEPVQPSRSRSSTPIQPRQSLGHGGAVPLPRAYSTSAADPNFPRDPRSQTNGFGTPPPDGSGAQPPSSAAPIPTQSPVPSHVKRFSLVDAPMPPPPTVVVQNGDGSSSPPPPPPETPTTLNSPPMDSVPLEQAPPAVQNSLAALKKAEALERRASKRFSTYTISKMAGGTVRERPGGSSGSGSSGAGNRRSLLAANGVLSPGDLVALAEEGEGASPRKNRDRQRSQRQRGPSPISEGDEPPPVPPLPKAPSPAPAAVAAASGSGSGRATPEVRVSAAAEEEPETETETTKPFPVFLQVGREVKKVMIEPGMAMVSLRMLFVDRFSYNPGKDNFPAVYIRDPSSGVQYELEDMDEIKPKVLLSLNIERTSTILSIREDVADQLLHSSGPDQAAHRYANLDTAPGA